MPPYSHVQQLNKCKQPDLELISVRWPKDYSKDTPHHHYLGFVLRTEHEQTFSLLGFLGWTRGFLPSYSYL